MAKRKKHKRKTWWQKHWDEVGFITAVILAIYYILKGTGYFA